jgi:hypothetical protein
MLLMIGTETAIMRAALLDRGGEFQRNRTGLIKAAGGGISCRVAIHQPLEYTVLRAAFA